MWTAQKEQQMKEMWRKGVKLSVIADEIDVSPSAISGKARRLNLPMRRRTVPKSTKIKEPPKTVSSVVKQRQERASTAYGCGPWANKFSELKPDQCMWPVGDPGDPDFIFCCAEKVNENYCKEHADLSVMPSREKKA